MATALETSHGIQITIAQISQLKSIFTSEVWIHGIPWKVKLFKGKAHDDNEKGHESCLAVRLICGNKDESLAWSIAGAVWCKLLSFDDDVRAHEQYAGPNVYDRTTKCAIYSTHLIKWSDLFDENNKYVKDDTIKLELKIEAENPNNRNRSSIQIESFEKICDCGCLALFRLAVKNVSNLMAVRTSRFDLRGLSWIIVVGKNSSSNLFALMDFDAQTNEISCHVAWTVKLLSSNANINPIVRYQSEQLLPSEYLSTENMASWSEIIKPENGYVNNDTITLEIQIITGKPQGEGVNDLSIAKRAKLNPENDNELLKLECPICLKCIANQELAVTPCGHMFCFECIKKAITGRAACPSCNKAITSNTLRQIYLPVVN